MCVMCNAIHYTHMPKTRNINKLRGLHFRMYVPVLSFLFYLIYFCFASRGAQLESKLSKTVSQMLINLLNRYIFAKNDLHKIVSLSCSFCRLFCLLLPLSEWSSWFPNVFVSLLSLINTPYGFVQNVAFASKKPIFLFVIFQQIVKRNFQPCNLEEEAVADVEEFLPTLNPQCISFFFSIVYFELRC